jgi:hypothetical protein
MSLNSTPGSVWDVIAGGTGQYSSVLNALLNYGFGPRAGRTPAPAIYTPVLAHPAPAPPPVQIPPPRAPDPPRGGVPGPDWLPPTDSNPHFGYPAYYGDWEDFEGDILEDDPGPDWEKTDPKWWNPIFQASLFTPGSIFYGSKGPKTRPKIGTRTPGRPRPHRAEDGVEYGSYGECVASADAQDLDWFEYCGIEGEPGVRARGPMPAPVPLPTVPNVVAGTVARTVARILPWLYVFWPSETSKDDEVQTQTQPRGPKARPRNRPRVMEEPDPVPPMGGPRTIPNEDPAFNPDPAYRPRPRPRPGVLDQPLELPNVNPSNFPQPYSVPTPAPVSVPFQWPALLPLLPLFAPTPGARPGRLPDILSPPRPGVTPTPLTMPLMQPVPLQSDSCVKQKPRKRKKRKSCRKCTKIKCKDK